MQRNIVIVVVVAIVAIGGAAYYFLGPGTVDETPQATAPAESAPAGETTEQESQPAPEPNAPAQPLLPSFEPPGGGN